LFKVRAEFATLMDRTPESEREFGLFVRSVVDDNHLPAFDCGAVARLVEYSARAAEDQDKLSTRFGKIADLILEAAYWAKKQAPPDNLDHAQVSAADVQRAIDDSMYRSNLAEERIQELLAQEVLLVDVKGSAVGQTNALSVLSVGDHTFGRPCRVTAAVNAGQGGILDIERQAKLGGPLHTKGVLIMGGFLGERYGQAQPLSLSASLAFEQSYDEIEGDSASAAELFALLSAIAQIPIRQDLAVTGSVNQHGQIQAVGGVNEKIESFFDTCKARELTGEQGVLIPDANRRHLMLRKDVIEAVAAGRFHIWPIATIDEGLLLLTGTEPGELQPDGSYPQETFNQRAAARLATFAGLARTSIEKQGEKGIDEQADDSG